MNIYQSCVQTCIAAGGSCDYSDALKNRYSNSDYLWRDDWSRAVDIRTCSLNNACANPTYKKNMWGYELHGNRMCYYGDRSRVCTDGNGVPSNFTGSAHRKLCPCTLFVCNGSYTSLPSPSPTVLPTFPLTSTPSLRPSISLEPSNSAIPTVQVRWVLAMEGRSCATTCAAVRGVLVDQYIRILERSN